MTFDPGGARGGDAGGEFQAPALEHLVRTLQHDDPLPRLVERI